MLQGINTNLTGINKHILFYIFKIKFPIKNLNCYVSISEDKIAIGISALIRYNAFDSIGGQWTQCFGYFAVPLLANPCSIKLLLIHLRDEIDYSQAAKLSIMYTYFKTPVNKPDVNDRMY